MPSPTIAVKGVSGKRDYNYPESTPTRTPLNFAGSDELGSAVKKEPKQEEPQVGAANELSHPSHLAECNSFVARAQRSFPTSPTPPVMQRKGCNYRGQSMPYPPRLSILKALSKHLFGGAEGTWSVCYPNAETFRAFRYDNFRFSVQFKSKTSVQKHFPSVETSVVEQSNNRRISRPRLLTRRAFQLLSQGGNNGSRRTKCRRNLLSGARPRLFVGLLP